MAKKKKSKPKQNGPASKKDSFRQTFFFRFIVITAAFLLLGAALFSWMPGNPNVNQIFMWVAVGIYLLAYIIVIILVECTILDRQGKLNKEYFKQSWNSFWERFRSFFKK